MSLKVTRAILLYNPAAGRFPLSRRRIVRILEKLHGMGIPAEAMATPPPGNGRGLDLEGCDLLIVCGGDGTLHDLIPEILRRKPLLAILPCGTANVLARELGIPRTTERALEVIRTGKSRRIYLGRAGDRLFHLMAGVGVDAFVISQVGRRLKRVLGVGAYWLAGFRSFWQFPLKPFRVELDGETHEATFALVSKSRFYGGNLQLTPNASLFEDRLDVCLFQSTRRLRFVRYLWGILSGSHLGYPDVLYRKTSRVSICPEQPVGVQMDGELAGWAPIEFAAGGDSLEVLVPY